MNDEQDALHELWKGRVIYLKNNKIIDSWNKIEPGSAAQERMLEHILKQRNRTGTARRWRAITAAAAAVVLLIGTALYSNYYLPGNNSLPDGPSVVTEDIKNMTDDIKGLPVNNFKLSQMEQSYAADRIAFFSFLNLFEYNTDSFVIVKVADTQSLAPEARYGSERQTAAVKVLQSIWGASVPEVMNITQYLYGGCTGDEATNLMRKGGVYLLPLTEDNGSYYLISDLDVLFEIDDQGYIWSHSDYEDFNQYDGQDYQSVVDEITRISRDDTLMLAVSGFGMIMRNFQLAEITILSDREEEKDEYGYAEDAYAVRVERTLSGGDITSEEVTVHSYAGENIPFIKGERYLVFLDNYNEKHYINKNMIAKVETDGAIDNLGDGRGPFADYNGYTVDKIKELADILTEYYKTVR